MKLLDTGLKISTLLLIIGALLLTVETRKESSYTAEKIQVVDGDTVKFNRSGGTETVRLLGVDTPEISSANNPSEYGLRDTLENRECLSEYALIAKNLTSNFVRGETIEISTDSAADRRGDYGRLLAYVKTDDGKNLNARLLNSGYARLYSSEFSEKRKFSSLEEAAMEKNIGLWSCG